MISLEKVGNAIKFTFNGNDHYLQDGTIEVPLNSLMLVTDESDMFTLKKSATNDIFVSGLYSEIGMSKSQLESWFKENAVGAGGTDEEKVQEMIDASISGKADVSALNVYADSVKYNPTTKYVEFYHNGTGGTKVFEYDASAFVIDGMVQNVEIKDVAISGEVVTCLVISFNTDAGKQDISIPISEIFDANNYYNKTQVDSKLNGKVSTSAITTSITSASTDSQVASAKAVYNDITIKERVTSTALNDLEQRKLDASAYTPTDLSNYYNKTETNTLLGGKQDTLEAGRGISITTGETADTVSFNLPIYAGTGTNSIIIGYRNPGSSTWDPIASGNDSIASGAACKARGNHSLAFGYTCQTTGENSVSINYGNTATARNSFAFGLSNKILNSAMAAAVGGYNNEAKTLAEFGVGNSNISVSASTTFGDSGNTLFSVGNGSGNPYTTATPVKHNAFEIRQNGDIYIADTNDTTYQNYYEKPMIKLQDALGGGSLGGYVTTDTEQIISGRKIFTYSDGSKKAIEFKQSRESSKVGFSIKNTASTDNELATFEFRPNTFKIDGVQHPLLYFGHYRTTNIANAGVPQTVIGFRQYDEKNAAAYHYLMPLPEKAKTPFSLTKSFKDYYAPMGFKNGSTMITADNTGVVDLSSELGGLKFVKLTQSEYDALATKDDNTMYVIVPAPPVPKITAKYNITDTTNPTLILYYGTFGITSMIVDGGAPESVTGYEYQFSTTGEHTVEFILSSTTVPYNMFGGGEGSDIPLTSVAFSDAITSMGSVFPGCENLTNIDWGNGVASLTMEGNFKNCRGLTSIVFPEQLVNFSKGDEVYDTYSDSNITSVTFSNRLTTFDTVWTMNPSRSRDFEVHLGSNITKVIFETGEDYLPTKFYIEATTPPITEVSEGISEVYGFTLYVPASAVSAYQADEKWSNYATGGIQAIPTA